MEKDIKFIYFDIGGVVILDFSKTNKWQEMTQALGVNEFNRQRFDEIFNEFEPEICIGKKSLDEFIRAVRSEIELKLPLNYSMLNDFVSRFEANVSLHPILSNLSEQYKLGLLTNMYPDMLNRIREVGILPSIKWDVIIDSSIVNFRKPQDGIYKLAEEMSCFNAGRILFVENSAIHIKAAKKRNWQTLLYDPSDISISNKELERKLKI